MIRTFAFGFAFATWLAVMAGCDSGFSGDPFENQPPDTQLSVRDTSLVDNIEEANRLTSSVFISWSGTDPDGFVAAYEIRVVGADAAGTGEWTRSTSTDSLILLPIPRGERTADVAFEVRAIDNEGLFDPTPARTVFPIQNSPPTLRLSAFDLPPDTTFGLISFSWTADDPEGAASLDRIEVSLNDSLNYVALPSDVDFITLVAPISDVAQAEVDAEVYLGRGFNRSAIRIPGMMLGDFNTIYLRAVDQTDTTSTRVDHTWFVKAQRSEVLFVNDYRKNTEAVMVPYHLDVLRQYLPPGIEIDVWNISTPYATGSQGSVPRGEAVPALADPTLSGHFSRWKYIYWLTAASTDRISTNNLPFSAGAMGGFFQSGGKLMVHSPVILPLDPEEAFDNAAVLLLPINQLVSFPDSLRPSLRLSLNAAIHSAQPVPGVSELMPDLKAGGFMINTLPYDAAGANTISLFEADYQYVTRDGRGRGVWYGATTIASISADRRVGLFALPLINEANGTPLVVGEADGDPATATRAVHLMLESLGFPR